MTADLKPDMQYFPPKTFELTEFKIVRATTSQRLGVDTNAIFPLQF